MHCSSMAICSANNSGEHQPLYNEIAHRICCMHFKVLLSNFTVTVLFLPLLIGCWLVVLMIVIDYYPMCDISREVVEV